MIKVICGEGEKKWLLKALENSSYGCPKKNRMEACIIEGTKGCSSATFNECIQRQINFDVK